MIFEACIRKRIDKIVNSAVNKTNADSQVIKLLELKYDTLKGIMARENERRQSVESKASIFIGSTSIIGAIIVGFSKLIFDSTKVYDNINVTVMVFMVMIVAYLAAAIYYAILTLKKKTYWIIDVNDLQESDNEKDYYLKLIKSSIKVLKHNEPLINDKVDWMVEAQNSFLIFGLWSIVYVFFIALYNTLIYFGVKYYFCISVAVSAILLIMGYHGVNGWTNKQKEKENDENEKVDKLIKSVCFFCYSTKQCEETDK